MSQPSNAVYVQITKNGTKLSVLYSASSTYPQSGQTLHLLLKKADKIWIQNITGKTAEFHDRGQYNLFFPVHLWQNCEINMVQKSMFLIFFSVKIIQLYIHLSQRRLQHNLVNDIFAFKPIEWSNYAV